MSFPDEMVVGLKNLKPITSVEQAREMGHKGGIQSTPSKSLAAKIRELKKKGVSDEAAQWIYDSMMSEDLSLYNIAVLLRSMTGQASNAKERAMVSRLLMDFHKIRHGTKETSHKVDVTSKEYKFIIETKVVGDAKADSLEADSEAGVSVQIPPGQ